MGQDFQTGGFDSGTIFKFWDLFPFTEQGMQKSAMIGLGYLSKIIFSFTGPICIDLYLCVVRFPDSGPNDRIFFGTLHGKSSMV